MRKSLFLVIACAAVTAPVAAQTPLPGLENFTLERPQPTPTATVAPTPVPTVTPPATPTAVPSSPSPSPTATATSRPTTAARPTVRATARPAATATPAPAAEATTPIEPVPSASATPEIASAPTPEAAAPQAAPAEPINWPLWAGLAASLIVGLGAVLWWRRRSAAEDFDEGYDEVVEPVRAAEPPAPPPAPLPTPVSPESPAQAQPPAPTQTPVAPSPSTPGGLVTSSLKRGGGGLITSALSPELRIALNPRRGGVDTLRATLEYEVQVGNVGRGTARGATVETWLISAGHQTAADLASVFASPGGESLLAPFDLSPSAAIDLAGVAVVPRDLLATITAGERRMFVPVLAVRVGFLDGRGTPQSLTAAFLVGIERDGQDRLGPLPLDRDSRMHDRLAARPFGG